jgi:hypothetical protein
MVTTESLVDSVVFRWLPLVLLNSSKSFLGLFSGTVTAFHREVIFSPIRTDQFRHLS